MTQTSDKKPAGMSWEEAMTPDPNVPPAPRPDGSFPSVAEFAKPLIEQDAAERADRRAWSMYHLGMAGLEEADATKARERGDMAAAAGHKENAAAARARAIEADPSSAHDVEAMTQHAGDA